MKGRRCRQRLAERAVLRWVRIPSSFTLYHLAMQQILLGLPLLILVQGSRARDVAILDSSIMVGSQMHAFPWKSGWQWQQMDSSQGVFETRRRRVILQVLSLLTFWWSACGSVLECSIVFNVPDISLACLKRISQSAFISIMTLLPYYLQNSEAQGQSWVRGS